MNKELREKKPQLARTDQEAEVKIKVMRITAAEEDMKQNGKNKELRKKKAKASKN